MIPETSLASPLLKVRIHFKFCALRRRDSMDATDGITDPTDWADTAVTSLQPLENGLRCQICKEFFVNPVITSCAHTFCSICIRRCLTHDGKCPTCRTDDQPIRLRKNAVVEELVDIFQRARPEILQMGREVAAARRGESAPLSLKRKLEEVDIADSEDAGSRTRRKTRSQSRRAPASATPSVYEVSDNDDEPQNTPTAKTLNDGKVECPICAQRMKEEEVFPHIDRDHSTPQTASAAPPRHSSSMFGLQRSSVNGTSTAVPEKLSALSYNLMNESSLRKRLGTMGIPNYGPKQVLEARHKEWLNIWNANCDSTRPRPKRDLLRDLDVWERTQGSQARGSSDANGIMSKEFDRDAWSHSNDNDFKSLVARARAKKQAGASEDNDKATPTPPLSNGDGPAVTGVDEVPIVRSDSTKPETMLFADR